MITPNFLVDQYVSAQIFDTAMSQLITSIRETGANDVFIIPGVINPASLTFTFGGTLQVTVGTPNTGVNAFKCFFQTGAIMAGHGIVNGVNSNTYVADFTSLIPITGSITAYIVAQYTQIQETATTIIGPPPGHPDYSAAFIPYVGYTQLQDTLNIFTTTTVPDNQVTIELARTTLVAGQTQVTSVDTSHQILAHVNVSSTLIGDVTGPITNNRISNLQGDPVNTTGRAPNNALVWNGIDWAPVALPSTLPPSGPAGGDLQGTYPNPQVLKSSVPVFTSNAIAAVGNISATGNLIGSAATLGNEAIILSQLGNIAALAPTNPITAGDIYHQSFTLPVLKGGTLAYILFNFGFYCVYGLPPSSVENKSVTVTYHTPFTQGALFAFTNWSTNDYTDTGAGAFQSASVTIETPVLNSPSSPLSSTIFYLDSDIVGGSIVNIAGHPNSSDIGLLGFWWIVGGI